jgi:hypothetical protein
LTLPKTTAIKPTFMIYAPVRRDKPARCCE